MAGNAVRNARITNRSKPMAFDLAGAARDLDERARRYAPIYAHPDVAEVVKLVHRNPWAAAAVRRALDAELDANPGKAVGLDKPLFNGSGRTVNLTE